ncbi:MAG: glycosyl hydrolase [Candidatus Sumerlaeota bacterium]|nr:glycosyl hydrolase [Candidatus Sumerlaeota bacterium]
MIKRLIGVALLCVCCAFTASAADELEKGFAAPPDSAKPWVYWFVMDGNFNREGITADLEAMKRVGIGGVLFMEVDVGIPKGPTKFMSEPWRALFKHANEEAARLGLVMTMPASPGWTGSGGPWVKPEQSMQKLVFSETNLAGPQKYDGVLAQPKAVAGYYRDVAVFAFRRQDADATANATPTGSYRIEDIEEKAVYRRGHFSSEKGVKAMLPAPAKYPALPAEQVIPLSGIVDLTDKMDAQGRLRWDAPPGNWTVLRFGHTSTGANTRPAPQPGLGLECDKFDKAALEAHFNDFLGKLMADIGPLTGKSLISLHIDSWEMGPQNWTAKFPDEFRTRRGYDLRKYLPVMTGRVVESLEVSERFLWDLRQTILELITENHAAYLAELAHKHGMILSIEPYDGTPCDDMTYGSRADTPMGEFWRDTFSTWFTCTEASSIAHIYGKRIIQAEAFTSGGGERWLAHPASLKALGDWAFCNGINRFVFHRYAHQPWADRWPGMTMGPYGIHYERTQTWWEMSRAWIQYLTRCQFLLQQGLFVADICFLAPEASPQVFRAPESATRGNPPDRLGYNFDACTAEALLTRMSVKDGRLVLPDGMSYRLLVLPKLQTMTPPMLRKIKELAAAGATIAGPPPLKSPSLSNYPKCDEEVNQLAAELWGEPRPNPASPASPASTSSTSSTEITERPYGKGRIISGRAFEDRPATEAIAPDTMNSLEHAKWIWHKEGNPAASAPVATRCFRRAFNIEAGRRIQSARASMTADNSFELWVNGKRAGAGDNFHEVVTMDLAALLKSGENILAVTGENGGDAPNPAGLIGSLSIQFSDGSALQLNTDKNWQTAIAVKDGWMTAAASGDGRTPADGWAAAMELGLPGMKPWGAVGKPLAQPQPSLYPDYKVIAGILAKMGIPPDFEADQELRYIHRRDGDADIYFVSNAQNTPTAANCTFRVTGKSPEIWDPISGETRLASAFKQENSRTIVPLQLDPAGSLFVIFRNPTDAAQSTGQNFPAIKPLQEIAGPWTVKFDPKWGGPQTIVFDTLTDWSKRPEEGIKYYSGTATYIKTFTLPPATPAQSQRLYLDLGKVEVMAQVNLNGKDLGILWKTPYRAGITDAIKPGENTLEITVVNLWPNRLIGDQSLPEDKRYTRTTWNPFKKDSPLLESGLIGPVTLQVSERVAVK